MESLPLHPKLVHLPLALAVLMPLLAGGLLAAWWRGWLPKRTWALAIAAQALLVASGVLAMRTGEGDEERVERFVPESAIEVHEESAEMFVWGAAVVLAAAFLPLLLKVSRPARLAGLAMVAGTVVVLFLGYRVGETGGALVYRHGAAAAFADAAVSPGSSSHMRWHDDDDDR